MIAIESKGPIFCQIAFKISLQIFRNFNSVLFIIKRKTMGCAAVCATNNIKINNHYIYSRTVLNNLLPQLSINQPLLTQQIYQKFSTELKQGGSQYFLSLGQSVSSEEQVPQAIKQKWKILLYGLFKSDQAYKNCLGFTLRNQLQQQKNYRDESTIQSRVLGSKSYHYIKVSTEYHNCFQQIQKDLNRTFEFKQDTKALLQRVLKKISNHFPSMGYTQGVNFVVGFLLVLGYSQSDTFWIFVHLATNKKYLLLGLYEDDFPLATIYTLLFKNLLKRYDYQLYQHLYEVIMLEDSAWVFKWFVTYFIYSFPLPTIKFVWDIAIQIGGVGLVYYAVALVVKLKSQLMKFDDACDITEYFQSLKALHNFNKYIKISEVVHLAYAVELEKQDFEGLNQLKDSFYKQYFVLMSQGFSQFKSNQNSVDDSTTQAAFIKNTEMTKKLHQWYQKLIRERFEFLKKSQEQKDKKFRIPNIFKQQYEDLQRGIQLLELKIEQNQTLRLTQKAIKQKSQAQILQIKSNILIEVQPTDRYTPNQAHKLKLATKPSYDISQEIDEMEGQSDSSCDQLQVSLQYHDSTKEKHPSEQLSISIQPQYKQEEHKQKENLNISMTLAQRSNNRSKAIKISNLQANQPEIMSGLSLVGQNILNNYGITNSRYTSNQLKDARMKPRKYKLHNIGNILKINSKVRTETDSSLDKTTEKDSLSGLSHRQRKEQRFATKDIENIQRKTQQEILNKSHVARTKKTNDVFKDLPSEIELFNGEGLFKKKKKLINRNSGITNLTNQVQIHAQSAAKIKVLSKHRTYNEEQCIESLVGFPSIRKSKKGANDHLYEIQSVK